MRRSSSQLRSSSETHKNRPRVWKSWWMSDELNDGSWFFFFFLKKRVAIQMMSQTIRLSRLSVSQPLHLHQFSIQNLGNEFKTLSFDRMKKRALLSLRSTIINPLAPLVDDQKEYLSQISITIPPIAALVDDEDRKHLSFITFSYSVWISLSLLSERYCEKKGEKITNLDLFMVRSVIHLETPKPGFWHHQFKVY